MQGYTYKNIFILLQNWKHGEEPADGNLLNKLRYVHTIGGYMTITMVMWVYIYWNESSLGSEDRLQTGFYKMSIKEKNMYKEKRLGEHHIGVSVWVVRL